MSERPKVTSHVTQEILLCRIERAIAIMSKVDGNDAADVQGTLQLCRKMLPSWRTGDPPEPGLYIFSSATGVGVAEFRPKGMGWESNATVIAWMPLPSPYQPEGE